MQTSSNPWKRVYFYWQSRWPEDISHVGNVLNITGSYIQRQDRQLLQTPDCCAAAISQSVKAPVLKVCSRLPWLQVGPGKAVKLTSWLSGPLSHGVIKSDLGLEGQQ